MKNIYGDVRPASTGNTYPVAVIGLGNGGRVEWYAENLHTGERGARHALQALAVIDAKRLHDKHIGKPEAASYSGCGLGV